MGLLDGYVVPVLCLPIFGEGLVDRLVELTGRIVGDIEDGGVSSEHGAHRQHTQNKCRAGGEGASNSHRRDLLCDNTINPICLVVFIKRGTYHIFPPQQSASLQNLCAAKIVSRGRSFRQILAEKKP